MPTYIVSVVLEGIELNDEVLDAVFSAIEDAVPSSTGGVLRVTAPVQAESDSSAAFALIEKLQAVLPQAIANRLDQDFVSIPDIAERLGRSRESVRLLVDGKRGPGGFPAPLGTVGDAIRVWPWAVVLEWLRTALGQDLGERGVLPSAAAVVDACLAGRRQLAFAHKREVTWTPALQRSELVVVSGPSIAGVAHPSEAALVA